MDLGRKVEGNGRERGGGWAGGRKESATTGKNSREVAKKNARENANRPLDITGEMFPDLPRFYLAACL